jgi:hypothetical protein
VEPAGGSDGTGGQWRIARKVAGDRVISAAGPDARHTRKSGEARCDGYRAHAAAEPQTGIITDEKLTRASGEDNSDPAAAAEFLAAEHASQDEHAGQGRAEPSGGTPGRQPLSWYADSAYGTGDLRDAIGQAGDAAVIKPKPLQPAVESGFTLDDFTVNEDERTVTCPNQITRRITARRNVTFGAACRGRPLHHRQDRPQPHPARTRRPAARRPPRLARAARGLHDTPAQRRASRRPGRHLPRPPAQAPLPGRNQEQRLAQVPNRRTEPAQPDRQGPDPARRRLGTGHLTSPALPAKPGKRTHASGPAVRQPRLRQPASP